MRSAKFYLFVIILAVIIAFPLSGSFVTASFVINPPPNIKCTLSEKASPYQVSARPYGGNDTFLLSMIHYVGIKQLCVENIPDAIIEKIRVSNERIGTSDWFYEYCYFAAPGKQPDTRIAGGSLTVVDGWSSYCVGDYSELGKRIAFFVIITIASVAGAVIWKKQRKKILAVWIVIALIYLILTLLEMFYLSYLV